MVWGEGEAKMGVGLLGIHSLSRGDYMHHGEVPRGCKVDTCAVGLRRLRSPIHLQPCAERVYTRAGHLHSTPLRCTLLEV